jgi:hypothetical protein
MMNMWSYSLFRFRFRGATQRLLNIYACFEEHSDQALHPAQIARETGLSLQEVTRRLDGTPELFVRLPKRPDGLTRYRLTTAARAKSPDEVEALVAAGARTESLSLYAMVAIVLCLAVLAVLMALPWLRFAF